MARKCKQAVIAAVALGTTMAWSTPGALAANSTWQNTDTDFNTPGNWSDGLPGSADQAIFATVASKQPNLGASYSVGQLNFSTVGSNGYAITASAGQSLTLNSGTVIIAKNTSGTNTISAPIVLGGGGTKLIQQSGTGTIAVSGALSEATAGTAVTYQRADAANPLYNITGANTYTGTTTLADGALTVNSIGSTTTAGALGKGTTFNFGTADSSRSASLAYTGGGETTDKIINLRTGSGGRTINTTGATGGLVFSNATFNVQGANGNAPLGLSGDTTGNAIYGNIPDAAHVDSTTAITKNGTGTWALHGTSSYLGITSVNAGTLLINGDQSLATGNVTVSNNATLGGIGIVGGNTAPALGGIIAPGNNGAGTLTFNQNLTVLGGASTIGSTVRFEGGDLIDVNGTLQLNDGWNLNLQTGFKDGGSVTLFTYTTAAATPNFDMTPDINISALGFVPSGSLTLTDTGNSIVLNGISVVPEPGVVGFGLGAITLAALRRRRSDSIG